jgi:hypothetical protein
LKSNIDGASQVRLGGDEHLVGTCGDVNGNCLALSKDGSALGLDLG